MDKFLEAYNLLSLKHEETENLNRPVTSRETESVIKYFTRIARKPRTIWLHQ